MEHLCDIQTVRALLSRYGFHFSKSMGQNFLVEEWVPQQIAAACGAGKGDGVLEIGPGIGTLTQQLCCRAEKVLAVELDRSLLPVLNETTADFDNFTLLNQDILKCNISVLVQEHLSPLRPLLCANLPYNITTPVLTALVESRCFASLTVLIQKEVALRICARPGSPDYGAFSLLMQYYTQPQLLFEVPNTCFIPQPKVTSAVLHCPVRPTPPIQVPDTAFFFRTVRAGFAQRRKTLLNSLSSGFSQLSKAQLAQAIRSVGLSDDVRGERLGLEEYAVLSRILWEFCKPNA